MIKAKQSREEARAYGQLTRPTPCMARAQAILGQAHVEQAVTLANRVGALEDRVSRAAVAEWAGLGLREQVHCLHAPPSLWACCPSMQVHGCSRRGCQLCLASLRPPLPR